MTKYDIQSVMLIPSNFQTDVNGDDHPAPGARPINLFDNATEVDLETLKLASEWFMRFGQYYHTENLFLSGAKVLNSCAPRLREKLEETTKDFRIPHKKGPVYFVLLYQLILSITPVSMRVVTRRLESIRLSDFDGNAVSLIKGVMGLLSNNDTLPADMVDISFRIMKTSSTDEFNNIFNLIRINHDLSVMKMEMSDLMFNLQKKYNELSLNGEWEIGTSNGQQPIFSCYSCGADDHMWRQCPNWMRIEYNKYCKTYLMVLLNPLSEDLEVAEAVVAEEPVLIVPMFFAHHRKPVNPIFDAEALYLNVGVELVVFGALMLQSNTMRQSRYR